MPDDTESSTNLAADAAVVAVLLGVGRPIALISGSVLLIATGFWIIGHVMPSIVFFSSIAMAVIQGYFALRVRFDATIFCIWAIRWKDPVDPLEDLKAFDIRVGRSPSSTVSMSADLAERKRGALRLLHYQAISGVLQLLLTAAALWP